MSERNGDRARFQKERMRKMLRRQRIQALTAAVQQRKDAASPAPRGDRSSRGIRCHARRRRSDALWRLSKHALRSPRSWRTACFLRDVADELVAAPSIAGGRKAAARRAAEHRAARGAGAGARRQLHHRSQPAPAPSGHVSAIRGQRPRAARRVSHAGRRRAHRAVRRVGGGLAPRQLPPRHVRDLRHPPESAAHLLAHAADAGVARARRSCPHLRDRGRADPPQRQPAGSPAADPVPEQLPARRAADDRRAVGVAEHAEAGAHRKPAPAGRGAAGGARRPPSPPTPTSRERTTPAASGRCRRTPTRRSSFSCFTASASTAFACRRFASRWTTTWRRGTPRRGDHPRRAPAAGRGAGLGGERRDEPPPVRDAGLAGVRRGGQPRRTRAAARSGGRVRTHGLPEPRPAAAGGRRAGDAEAAKARCASRCKAIESARQAAAQRLDRRSRGPRRAITSSIAGARDLEADLAYRPGCADAGAARPAAPRVTASTSARLRS